MEGYARILEKEGKRRDSNWLEGWVKDLIKIGFIRLASLGNRSCIISMILSDHCEARIPNNVPERLLNCPLA